MKWRFLAFLPSLPPLAELRGGTQIRPFELLSRFATLGHRVEVFETDRRGTPWGEGSMRVAPVATRRRGALGLALRLAELRRRLAAVAREAREQGERLCYYTQVPSGVVFKGGVLPAPTHPGAFLLGEARRRGAVTWAAVHDLSPDQEHDLYARAPEAWTPGARRRLLMAGRLCELQQRAILPKADFVTGVTPPLCDALRSRYGLDPARLKVFWGGAAPNLVEPIPAWEPPVDRPWRFGYLGSPFDVSFDLLARSLRELDRDDVILVLGGVDASRHADRARAHYPRVETRDGVRYADYASFAREIDLWALPYEDPYGLNLGWELKIPLALASGRPVVRTGGPSAESSELKEHIWIAPPGTSSFVSVVREVLADPERARSRALAARADVLARYRWSDLADPLLEALERVAASGA